MEKIQGKDTIENKGQEIQVQLMKGENFSYDFNRVRSSGTLKWECRLENPAGGYSMFFEPFLLPLSKRYFAVVQYYEHAKGGHRDSYLSLLDYEGKVLWSYYAYGSYLKEVFLDGKKLYFFHRDRRKANLALTGFMRAPILAQLDLRTGRERFHFSLDKIRQLPKPKGQMRNWLLQYDYLDFQKQTDRGEHSFLYFEGVKKGEPIARNLKISLRDFLGAFG